MYQLMPTLSRAGLLKQEEGSPHTSGFEEELSAFTYTVIQQTSSAHCMRSAMLDAKNDE